MRLLLFYAHHFSYTPYARALDHPAVEEAPSPGRWEECVAVFYHCEEQDRGRETHLARKAAKNVKWLARKFGASTVVLHSFNHLSVSKADPDVALQVVADLEERLRRVGLEVHHTPFGYLNRWSMDVAGESLAKVFKEL